MLLVFTWPIIKYTYKLILYITQIFKKLAPRVENLDLSQVETVNQELNKVKSSAEACARIEMALSMLAEIISEVQKTSMNSLDAKLENSIHSIEKQISSLDAKLENSIRSLEKQNMKLEKGILSVDKQINSLDKAINSILSPDKQIKSLDKLENSVHSLESHIHSQDIKLERYKFF